MWWCRGAGSESIITQEGDYEVWENFGVRLDPPHDLKKNCHKNESCPCTHVLQASKRAHLMPCAEEKRAMHHQQKK